MDLEHLMKILDETRETFACTGLDREPDAKQVVDYIEARVRGVSKVKNTAELRAALWSAS